MSYLSSIKAINLIIKNTNSDSEVRQLLECFDFDSLININILDHELVRCHVILLKKLIVHDLFYQIEKPVRPTLNFLLYNVGTLRNIPSSETLSWFLDLLKEIIHKTKDLEAFTLFYQKKTQDYFKIVSLCTQIDLFNINHVSHFTAIICDLLMVDGTLDDSCSQNFTDVINTFEKLNAFYEIVCISEVVTEKYPLSSIIFNLFSSWTIKIGIKLLDKDTEKRLSLKLLKNFDLLYMRYEASKITETYANTDLRKSIERGIQFLSKSPEILLSFFTEPDLKKYSSKLFAYMLANQNSQNSWEFFYKKLKYLPADLTEWINSDPDIFLRICYTLCINDTIVWSPGNILMVIGNLIYSEKRYQLKPFLLKIICHLYPYMMAYSYSKMNAILGNDILTLISNHRYDFNSIFSLQISQLNWILRRGNVSLKKAVVYFWLKNEEQLDILKKCVLRNNMQNLLIEIVKDSNEDPDIAMRTGELMRSIEDPVYKTAIAKILPVVYYNPPVFNILMRANPGIPKNKTLALALAKFMALILVFTTDEETFGLLCDYSKNLVVCLKHDGSVLNVFCKDYRNIKLILKRLNLLGDETATKALGLIKALLLVEQRNHIITDYPKDVDLVHALRGSIQKIEKGLDVLNLLTKKRLFMRLSQKSSYSVFVRLLVLTEMAELSEKCLTCLTSILKYNPQFATTYSTNIFVEKRCSLAVNEKHCDELFAFLQAWMSILKNSWQKHVIFHAQSLEIVKSYLKRMPGYPKHRETSLLDDLRDLEKKFPKLSLE